jgi:hypothetical protein
LRHPRCLKLATSGCDSNYYGASARYDCFFNIQFRQADIDRAPGQAHLSYAESTSPMGETIGGFGVAVIRDITEEQQVRRLQLHFILRRTHQ